MSEYFVLEDILKEVSSTHYDSIDELQNILLSEKILLTKILEIRLSDLKPNQVDDVRIRFCGKKSPLQELLKSLKKSPC